MNQEPDAPADFPMTRWSLVARVGDPAALAELCEAYWYPIYALIRRKGNAPDRAMDLTQSYFARLIERQTIAGAVPERGRFRAFLRADCTFFLADTHDHDRARKRGGGVRVVSIDSAFAESCFAREPAHAETPERRFERDWAVSLIDQAMKRLEREYADGGRSEIFARLKPGLTAHADAVPYAQIASELKTTEGALRTATHRLRSRFAVALRAEIASTLDNPTPELIAEELRDLFAALAK